MDWLVVCGLDGALIGDEAALTQVNAALAQARPRLVLAYLTGRSLSSVMELKEQVPLLPADLLICDAGTSLYRRNGESYTPIVEWMNLLNGDWNRNRVEAIAHSFQLIEQAQEHQGPFKCSYYLDPAQAEVLPRLQEQVALIDAYVVYKAGFLDILPTNSAEVVDYLRTLLGVTEEKTIVCAGVFTDEHYTELGVKSVVVPPAAMASPHNGTLTYHAQAPYGLGVLEGLRYWGLLTV
ncbi:HAD family hydrolase [Candidatus Cyanaurora vandensis]|uniref:HAD family hydrolase n=1 Tax=Candidatus Cyanaurora vandensis TaxID=2714958 RepID=UPI00258073D1|nr:HAD family hydrolase [Candidatus Cyanaurora vandensis]